MFPIFNTLYEMDNKRNHLKVHKHGKDARYLTTFIQYLNHPDLMLAFIIPRDSDQFMQQTNVTTT